MRFINVLIFLISLISLISFFSPSYSSSLSILEEDLFIDRLSYCKQEEIKSFSCDDCDNNDRSLIGVYDPSSKASSQVVVVVDKKEDEILVGFRGTINNIQQWISDLDTVYTSLGKEKGKVHSGFYARFNEIKQPTLSFLKKARKSYPDADIIISGHSMGGALATLFASYLKDKESNELHPSYIYTYGSPRVGDNTFSTYVDKQFSNKLLRVMNELDMVTDLPPKALGYRHTGKLILCKTGKTECEEKGRMEENPGGLMMALKRTIATAKNVNLCHLTYLGKTIGTKRYKCL